MRLPMALSAALAALVLAAATLLGPAPAAVAAVAVVLVISWGWPRQMGAPARLSLSATIASTGVLGVLLMLLWPAPSTGHGDAWALLEPLAVLLAWGTMAAFVVQLVRGTGRPLRLESTVATMGGVVIAVMSASWVAMARWSAVPEVRGLVLALAITVAVVSLLGLTPWMQGRPGVLALVVIPASALAAWAAGALAGTAPRELAALTLSSLSAATLVALTASTAPSSRPRPEDRPVATTLRPRRAGYALAMAPVGAAGVIGHVMVGLLA
ncbi:hypothetical protein [Micrococcus sp. NPDC055215]